MATVIGDSLPPLLMERLHPQSAIRNPRIRTCWSPRPCPSAPSTPRACRTRRCSATRSWPPTTRDACGRRSTAPAARHGILRAHGKVALLFVDPEGTYYVKAIVSGPDAPHPTSPAVAVFPLTVVAVLADAVDTSREPAAVITSGIRFRRSPRLRPRKEPACDPAPSPHRRPQRRQWLHLRHPTARATAGQRRRVAPRAQPLGCTDARPRDQLHRGAGAAPGDRRCTRRRTRARRFRAGRSSRWAWSCCRAA